jgi:hypothetical protein
MIEVPAVDSILIGLTPLLDWRLGIVGYASRVDVQLKWG